MIASLKLSDGNNCINMQKSFESYFEQQHHRRVVRKQQPVDYFTEELTIMIFNSYAIQFTIRVGSHLFSLQLSSFRSHKAL